MTTLRKAAEHLLETWDKGTHSVVDALDILRAALAEPAPAKSACIYPQCVSTTRTQCDAWASGACEGHP